MSELDDIGPAPESGLDPVPDSVTLETEVTDSAERAAEFIRRSEPVAFPTETVYGLGASVYDERAIRRIYEAKGRPTSNPLIAHISDYRHVEELAATVPPPARRLIEAFFPGPLTIVVPRARNIPAAATAGLDTIGIRMPDHALARTLIRAVGVPLVAPSANRSGRPSPTTWEAVRDDLNGRIACILRGERARAGLESTVVDCTEDVPVLLRPGSVPLEDLRGVVPDIVANIPDADRLARSPGTRFRHYSPDAAVILVSDPSGAVPSSDAAFIGFSAPNGATDFASMRLCQDEAEYAFELFDFLRACDRMGLRRVYCELPSEHGIGRALLDRLGRAAES